MSDPKGVCAVVNFPDGGVLVSETDFNRDGYGGLTLFEAQRYRVRIAVQRAALRALCHPDVIDCVDSYHLEQIFRQMVEKKGYAMTLLPIGHEGEEKEEERRARR